MSYYSSNYSSASLLDPNCAGGSRYNSSGFGDSLFDRKDNTYNYPSTTYSSAYSGSSGLSSDYLSSSHRSTRPTAYDRYVSYLSDELTTGTSASSRR